MKRFLQILGLLVGLVTIVALLDLWLPGIGVLLLPLDWPGVFVAGMQWDNIYGHVGSHIAMVIFSIPICVLIAAIMSLLFFDGDKPKK